MTTLTAPEGQVLYLDQADGTRLYAHEIVAPSAEQADLWQLCPISEMPE